MAVHLIGPDSDASCQQQGEGGEHEGRHAQNDRCESWNGPVNMTLDIRGGEQYNVVASKQIPLASQTLLGHREQLNFDRHSKQIKLGGMLWCTCARCWSCGPRCAGSLMRTRSCGWNVASLLQIMQNLSSYLVSLTCHIHAQRALA